MSFIFKTLSFSAGGFVQISCCVRAIEDEFRPLLIFFFYHLVSQNGFKQPAGMSGNSEGWNMLDQAARLHGCYSEMLALAVPSVLVWNVDVLLPAGS